MLLPVKCWLYAFFFFPWHFLKKIPPMTVQHLLFPDGFFPTHIIHSQYLFLVTMYNLLPKCTRPFFKLRVAVPKLCRGFPSNVRPPNCFWESWSQHSLIPFHVKGLEKTKKKERLHNRICKWWMNIKCYVEPLSNSCTFVHLMVFLSNVFFPISARSSLRSHHIPRFQRPLTFYRINNLNISFCNIFQNSRGDEWCLTVMSS